MYEQHERREMELGLLLILEAVTPAVSLGLQSSLISPMKRNKAWYGKLILFSEIGRFGGTQSLPRA